MRTSFKESLESNRKSVLTTYSTSMPNSLKFEFGFHHTHRYELDNLENETKSAESNSTIKHLGIA